MKKFVRMTYVCLLPLTLAAAGCETVSLINRDDPYARDRRDIDRDREVRRDQDWQRADRDRARDEIVGTVQRVDRDRREIQLRTTDGQLTWIKYEPSTRVYHRDGDLRVDELRYGDLVRVEVSRDNRGERYAELIRMNDRGDLGSSRW
jgi:hypothetical protein